MPLGGLAATGRWHHTLDRARMHSRAVRRPIQTASLGAALSACSRSGRKASVGMRWSPCGRSGAKPNRCARRAAPTGGRAFPGGAGSSSSWTCPRRPHLDVTRHLGVGARHKRSSPRYHTRAAARAIRATRKSRRSALLADHLRGERVPRQRHSVIPYVSRFGEAQPRGNELGR